MANPYEGVQEAKEAVRGFIEDHEYDAQSALMFSDRYVTVKGVGLGFATFKDSESETVVFARKGEYIVSDSRTVSQLSEIEARYEMQVGLPENVEQYINRKEITKPDRK